MTAHQIEVAFPLTFDKTKALFESTRTVRFY